MTAPRLRFWHAGHPLQLVLGLSLWALCFVAAYALVSWGCETIGPPPGRTGGLRALLLGGCVATALLLLLAAWRCRRAAHDERTARVPQQRFVAGAAAALYLWAAAGTALVALPLALIPPCV